VSQAQKEETVAKDEKNTKTETPLNKSNVEGGVMPLHNEILALLKKRMNMKYEYINPNFLTAITMALSDYYECEDNDIDDWIQDMYGA
jgi:hypothetical protein